MGAEEGAPGQKEVSSLFTKTGSSGDIAGGVCFSHWFVFVCKCSFNSVIFHGEKRFHWLPAVHSSYQSLEREGLLWQAYTPLALEEPLPFGWGIWGPFAFRW